MGALIALARGALAPVFGGGGRALVRRVGVPIAAGVAGAGLGELAFGGEGRPRRRRRRRVLTANDRSDIAFIVATLGPGAGKAFAMIVAART